jgi:hypothetical protein
VKHPKSALQIWGWVITFEVGIYGSGLSCKEVIKAGLSKYCWLAADMSLPLSKLMRAKGEYDILQHPTSDKKLCGGVSVDLNTVKTSDFGQWRDGAAL